MLDALLLGGPCHDTKIDRGGSVPPTIRPVDCGRSIILIFPAQVASEDRPGGRVYLPHAGDAYVLTGHATDAGLAIYAWRTRDGWTSDGRVSRRGGVAVDERLAGVDFT